MRGERRQGRTKRRNVRYVVIKKPFIKTFAAVLLTSLVPDSHTRINFAFRRKAGRDVCRRNEHIGGTLCVTTTTNVSMSSSITGLSIYVLEFSQQDCFLRDG